jgi:uncharacterized protein
MITVSALSVTAIKATRLRTVESIVLGPNGADGNRRLYLIDDHGRMVNAKTIGELQQVLAGLEGDRLSITLPDGTVVEDVLTAGDTVETQFFSLAREARLVNGPFADAVSNFVGRPLRLVEPSGGAVDRGTDGGVTAISRASLERLASEAKADGVDARRFRMLVEVDGLCAHEEDTWVGRRAQIGDAVVAFGGHVGRCLITSRDPDSGQIDLPTLDILRDYRGDVESTEPLPFGVYGSVLEGGVVRVGDKVTPQ